MSDTSSQPADIGMIGLGVMGRNLSLNMTDHGFRVAVHDINLPAIDDFVEANPDTPGGLVGCHTYKQLASALSRPRRIVLLVPAGKPVDAVLTQLQPLLDEGDVVIDAGNSLWTNTMQRGERLAQRGIHFVGSGTSGGEEGARFGPSLMPGCSVEAWEAIRPVWEAIAAKVDEKTGKPLEGAEPGRPVEGGVPCTTHVGPDGAGHYVKMVHNGIEYGDMQLICEAYFLMARLLGMKPKSISQVFAKWNEGDLDSYLIEITADILQQKDPTNKRKFLVDQVLDTAGQKGTGRWTSVSSLQMGVPLPTIADAVYARFISALKEERVAAAGKLKGPKYKFAGDKEECIEAIGTALYCAKICSYAQGFALLARAAAEYAWTLDYAAIARIWRGGCIIRARFLQKINDAYVKDPGLANLLLDPFFKKRIHAGQAAWRKVVVLATEAGVPCPGFMSALAYYDSYRSERLPANLLQAQRDYFGAHGFERLDASRGSFFHVDWPDPERPQQER